MPDQYVYRTPATISRNTNSPAIMDKNPVVDDVPTRFRDIDTRALGWFLMILFLVLAFVLFRAGSLEEAGIIYRGMLGINGAPLPSQLFEIFPFLEARVGVAALPLDAREPTVRNRESGWGNFIADQMRGAFGKPAADLAFINGGTLRIDDMIENDIHFEDIARTFGFSSFLRYTTITGAEFRKLMEAGYRGSGTQGYFPQISGFRICVDRSRNDGDRIVSLQVPVDNGWAEIEANREYSLVVPDFLYSGGDGYQVPKDRPASRPGSELKYLVLDAILAAQSQGLEVGIAIDNVNRRYHELHEGKKPCFATADR